MAQSKLQKITTNFHHVKYFMLQRVNTAGDSFAVMKPFMSSDTNRAITLANHYLCLARLSLTEDIVEAKRKIKASK